MKCLCCGKELNTSLNSEWHQYCIKRFFGTTKIPIIDLNSDNESLNELGNNLIEERKNVTGVQKKLSLHLSIEKNNKRLTIIGKPQGFILKTNSKEMPYIAEIEHLTMLMANECGIKTPMHGLIKLQNNSYAYIIKRMDRNENDKIHMEDFCQLSKRLTENKYNSSYERCAKVIDDYSNIKVLDKIELFYRLLFCYITGNSDMHLKNFSLIDSPKGYCLSKAYDLLPVQILKNDTDELALSLNGKKSEIRLNDFLKFSETIKIDKVVTNRLINKLINKQDDLIQMVIEANIPVELKDDFIKLIKERINNLK